jgi:hypothetical protein
MAAARQRLKDLGWARGYCIHRDGQGIWNAMEGAWSLGLPPAQDPMALQEHGCWHDPQGFQASEQFRSRHREFTRRMRWNLFSPWIERAIRDLRQDERDLPPGTPSRKPS